MPTINKLFPHGEGLAPALVKRAATIELDAATCKLHRFEATDSQGRALQVDLPEGSQLCDGDVLLVDDGSLVRVVAPEAGHHHAHAPVRKAIGIKVTAAEPHVHGPHCKH